MRLLIALALLVPSVGLAQVRFDVSLGDDRVRPRTTRLLAFDGASYFVTSTTTPTGGDALHVVEGDGSLSEQFGSGSTTIACTVDACADSSFTVPTQIARWDRASGRRVGFTTIPTEARAARPIRAGDEWLVVASISSESETRIEAVHVSEAGVVEQAAPFEIARFPTPGLSFDVACDQRRCVVGYVGQEGSSFGVVVLDDETPSVPIPLGTVSSAGWRPRVAIGGGRVVLVLSDSSEGFGFRAWRGAVDGSGFGRVGPDGGATTSLLASVGCMASGDCFALDRLGSVVHLPPTGMATLFESEATALACGLDDCLTDREVFAMVGGVPTRTRPFGYGDLVQQSLPSVAVRDGRVVVALRDTFTTPAGSFFVGELDASGRWASPFATPTSTQPLLLEAFDFGFFAASVTSTSGGTALARRLGPDGSALEMSAATLGAATRVDAVRADEHLLAALSGSTVRTRRVNALGAAEGDEPVVVRSVPSSDATLATGGGVSLVAWSEERGARELEIYGAIVDSSGELVGTHFLISTGDFDQHTPRVMWVGDAFVVVWLDARDGTGTAIRGARVSSAGVVLDPTGVTFVPSFASATSELAAVADGPEIVLAWTPRESRSDALGEYDANFVRVRRSSAAGDALETTTVRDGGRSNDEYHTLALVRSGPGELVLLFEQRGAPRNTVRAVAFGYAGVPGATCGDATACTSGFCVDGVCCDAACDGACATCRASEGASTDGACAAHPAGVECRGASDACDLAESCDGESLVCPDDLRMPMCGEDAGMPDGGPGDAGASRDAGASSDAGAMSDDASVAADAGTGDEDSGTGGGGGGGCSAGGAAGSMLPAWLVAVALMRRRRRDRSPTA